MSPTWTIYGLKALEAINKHTNSSDIRVVLYFEESKELFQESFSLDELFVIAPTVRSLKPKPSVITSTVIKGENE